MPEPASRRVFIKQHDLAQLFGHSMAQGEEGPVHIEGHEVHRLYRGFTAPGLGPTTHAGSTAHFDVCFETTLGDLGAETANEVLVKCEPDYEALFGWFKVSIPHFNVIISRVSEETLELAYHEDCYATNLYCDAPSPSDPPNYTAALMVSEATEVFEAYQHKGWDCGKANGEGLSRTLASALHPNALDHHSCAPAWLDGGRLDVVNYNYPTDTNQLANGCAVLFLNWLNHSLGYDWGKIVSAAAPNLAATYRLLTGSKEDPFPRFLAFINRLFPANRRWPKVPDEPFSSIYANAAIVHGGPGEHHRVQHEHQVEPPPHRVDSGRKRETGDEKEARFQPRIFRNGRR